MESGKYVSEIEKLREEIGRVVRGAALRMRSRDQIRREVKVLRRYLKKAGAKGVKCRANGRTIDVEARLPTCPAEVKLESGVEI